MTTIFIKDDLRASVEAATGGLVTVLYTAAGHPSYMNVLSMASRSPNYSSASISASRRMAICCPFPACRRLPARTSTPSVAGPPPTAQAGT